MNQIYVEENIAFEIFGYFIKMKMDPKDITIIVTYNKQLNYLRSIMNSETSIITIDKSQGMESKVVILVLGLN